MVKPAHSIVIPPSSETLWVRIANVNSQSETPQKGKFVATMYPDVCISYCGMETMSLPKITGYKVGEELTKEQQRELGTLIQEYRSVMWMPGDSLPVVNVGVEHNIDLKPGAEPKMSKPRRLSQAEMVEVRDEIEGLLQQGLIETSSSPWSAPIVCARRKNGG